MNEKVNKKRFVRYIEGAKLYSMSQSKFEAMAKDAKAMSHASIETAMDIYAEVTEMKKKEAFDNLSANLDVS